MSSDPIRSLVAAIRRVDPPRQLSRARRMMLIARVRASALWHRATIDLDLAADLKVGRDVRITVEPRTHNVLKIGPRSYVQDRVTIMLKGGTVVFGPECGLRHGALLNVSGHVEFVDTNVLSWGCVLHCAESVRLEKYAGAAEHVTIADSTHYFTEADTYFYNNVRTEPIVIGENTWLCPKATITSGVRIGAHCIIASNSVVTDDVPDGHLASGVPASFMRPLRLPWAEERRG